jgi:hypothetical protein
MQSPYISGLLAKPNSQLTGKSILLISPNFFGYDLAIKDKLTQMGAKVILFDDRPGNGLISKSLIRLDKRLLEQKIDQYYQKITHQISDIKFDIVFLLNPEALPISFLQFCRSRWPDALHVMYMWDSIRNRKHTLEFVPFCDRVFTFDVDDASLPDFQFKPLFYLDIYESIRRTQHPSHYDICFMGTLHSDRYMIAKEIKNWCEHQNLRCFFYFFAQSRFVYYFNKLIRHSVTAPRSEVSFKKMTTSHLTHVVASSRVILDIQHPKQTGLTMRTLETLGAGKKLITTNAQIENYDFYDPKSISVVSRSEPTKSLDPSFFLESVSSIPESIISQYSIGRWLVDLLA